MDERGGRYACARPGIAVLPLARRVWREWRERRPSRCGHCAVLDRCVDRRQPCCLGLDDGAPPEAVRVEREAAAAVHLQGRVRGRGGEVGAEGVDASAVLQDGGCHLPRGWWGGGPWECRPRPRCCRCTRRRGGGCQRHPPWPLEEEIPKKGRRVGGFTDTSMPLPMGGGAWQRDDAAIS